MLHGSMSSFGGAVPRRRKMSLLQSLRQQNKVPKSGSVSGLESFNCRRLPTPVWTWLVNAPIARVRHLQEAVLLYRPLRVLSALSSRSKHQYLELELSVRYPKLRLCIWRTKALFGGRKDSRPQLESRKTMHSIHTTTPTEFSQSCDPINGEYRNGHIGDYYGRPAGDWSLLLGETGNGY